MKKFFAVSTIAALGFASAALAGGLPEEMPVAPVASSDTGFYLGIEGGYDKLNWKNLDGPDYSVSKDGGVVGRVFLGYDINKYFAAEFGYSYFFNKAKVADPTDPDVNYSRFRTQNLDLFGKGKLPVTDEFSLFAKAGASYLYRNMDNYGSYDFDTGRAFGVAYGVGADYAITPNVIASLEWLHNPGNTVLNDFNYYVPQSDSIMIGVRYKFDL